MLEEAKYSIIQYCNEVTKDNLKKYTNLIKRGIIVHLLLKENMFSAKRFYRQTLSKSYFLL